MTDAPPWNVTYTVWDKRDDEPRDTATFSGFFNEPTPVDCVNAIVYDLRGEKSRWELAYVDEIEPVGHDET